LEEVGEFEGTDVAASLTDPASEVENDSLEIALVEAGMEEFIPEPSAVKAQAHALAGEPTIERVSLLDSLSGPSPGSLRFGESFPMRGNRSFSAVSGGGTYSVVATSSALGLKFRRI
jgi:hypothetical protein